MQNNFADYSLFGNKKLEVFALSMIPQHIRMNYPNFVRFFTLFLEKTSKEREGTEFIHNMLAYANIDETNALFVEEFCHNFLKDLQYLPEVNRRTLVKWIKQWYEATGSEQSFKFLFRVLYNEDVEFYYPSIDMLRVSDGKWAKERVITVVRDQSNWTEEERIQNVGLVVPTDEQYKDMVGTEIRGSVSHALGLVERIEFDEIWIDHDEVDTTERIRLDTVKIYITEFDRQHPISDFLPNDQVMCTTLHDPSFTFSNPISFVVDQIEITDENFLGEYYQIGDTVTVQHPMGSGCVAVVDSVSSGYFTDVLVVDGGRYYKVGERFEIKDGYGYGCYGFISSVDASGAIKGIRIISPGEDYMRYPEIVVETENGRGAILVPIAKNVGGIKSMKIINPGVGYRDVTWKDIKNCFQNLITITSASPIGYCRNVPRLDVGYDGTLNPADKVAQNGLNELSFTELSAADQEYFEHKVKEVRKSYTFPIEFTKTAIQARAISDVSIMFYREANNNTPYLSRNEIILAEIFPNRYAKGRIKRINNDLGHMIVEKLSHEEFMAGAEIVGSASSSSGNIIVKSSKSNFKIKTGPVGEIPGYYKNRDSWVSSEKKIQDSYFYQVFSYVLKTQVPKEKWKINVQNAVHPSGLIVFGMDEVEDRYGHSYGGNPVSTEKDICLPAKFKYEAI